MTLLLAVAALIAALTYLNVKTATSDAYGVLLKNVTYAVLLASTLIAAVLVVVLAHRELYQ